MSIPPFKTAANLSGISGITHGFFGRRGGVSSGLYESLNAGAGSDDAPDAVATNRERIRSAMSATALLSCHQIHSADITHVTAPWEERPKGDAMVTTQPGLALCILTADCTPILFADRDAGIIGAAHAGWKGAIGGVLEATIDAMTQLGAQADRIHAAIGPTIQQASYEVGPEFRETFLKASETHEALFIPGQGDRFHFDLPGYCRQRLDEIGVFSVHDLGLDTCALENDYHSNRRRNLRGEADYGRNASVIMIAS
mgnify:CR=1 FL=1